MNGTSNPDHTATTGDADDLDPREAARLLDEARREAHRQFDLQPPLFSVLAAAVVLIAYGALWLSSRGQHPYKGPSGAAIALVYTGVIVAAAVGSKVVRRATAGVTGRSRRQMKAERWVIAAAYIGTAALQGALKYQGASQAIVYGVFPAAAPLVVVGCTVAGIAAAREDWNLFGTGLAVAVVGTGAAFAAPAASWAVAGLGLFLAILGHGLANALTRRAHA